MVDETVSNTAFVSKMGMQHLSKQSLIKIALLTLPTARDKIISLIMIFKDVDNKTAISTEHHCCWQILEISCQNCLICFLSLRSDYNQIAFSSSDMTLTILFLR